MVLTTASVAVSITVTTTEKKGRGRTGCHIEAGAVGFYIYCPEEADDGIDDRIGAGVDD